VLELSDFEARMLSGADGKAKQLAMQMMVAAAEVAEATEFVEVTFAHVGSGFYSGQVSVDFAEFMLAEGGEVSVPSYTNSSLVDFSCPQLRPLERFPTEVQGAQRLMQIYEQLGCLPMWSCAPYHQAEGRPGLGQQIVGSESNAVSFFNSVLGARTNKYGDFLDLCGAIAGRVPLAGLHQTESRFATHVFRLDQLDPAMADHSTFHHVLGILLGREAGSAIPVIDGLAEASEDHLKAIAAAGATSGAVEMFHVVGITPEAATLEAALGGRPPKTETVVTRALMHETRAALTTDDTGPLRAVCLGTPHFSVEEFAKLASQFRGRRVHKDIQVIVTTSRAVFAEIQLRRWDVELAEAGVQISLDTCTYFTPTTSGINGLAMTCSAKWAYYAPGILGVPVAFGSQAECVESAIGGFVHREEEW
jgi:predicted aconitase